jgi:hypothetical protein
LFNWHSFANDRSEIARLSRAVVWKRPMSTGNSAITAWGLATFDLRDRVAQVDLNLERADQPADFGRRTSDHPFQVVALGEESTEQAGLAWCRSGSWRPTKRCTTAVSASPRGTRGWSTDALCGPSACPLPRRRRAYKAHRHWRVEGGPRARSMVRAGYQGRAPVPATVPRKLRATWICVQTTTPTFCLKGS